MFVRPVDDGLFPDYNFYAFVRPLDGGGPVMNAPVLSAGRPLDPARLDEVVISELLASRLHVTVGDPLPIESMSADWMNNAYNGGEVGPTDGPRMTMTVVGIMRTPSDFGRWVGTMEISPAFFDRWSDDFQVYEFTHIRFRDDAPVRSPEELGVPDAQVSPFGDDAATGSGLEVLATGLRLLALVCAIVGVVCFALVAARVAAVPDAENATLSALGWTSSRRRASTLAVLSPSAMAGVLIGTAVGYLLSPHALVGLAARVEPDRERIDVPGVLTSVVALGAVLVVAAVIALVSWRASASRRTAVVEHARGVAATRPIAVALGVRHALLERDGSSRSARAAIAVAALGIVGAIAALSVSTSIAHLDGHPALWGSTDEKSIDVGESEGAYDNAIGRLANDHDVDLLAGMHVDTFTLDGADVVNGLVVDELRGHLEDTLVEGRAAAGNDEVLLGPGTLADLGKQVGDTIEIAGPSGSGTYRVTGAMLFPEGDFAHDQGLAMSIASSRPVVLDPQTQMSLHFVLFTWAADVDAVAGDARLADAGLRVEEQTEAVVPGDVSNIFQVRTLPLVLAAFLAAICAVIILQSVVTSARRRRAELATLRALGAAGSLVVGATLVEALCVAVLSLGLGALGGVLLGRLVWREIAASIPVVDQWSMSVAVGTVAAVAILTAVVAMAVVVGVRVSRSTVIEGMRRD